MTNLIDATNFAIASSSNWEIISQTKTTLSVRHKTSYTTGAPQINLNLPAGTYKITANFTASSVSNFNLYINNTWKKLLNNGDLFEVVNGDAVKLIFSTTTQETFTITNICLVNIDNVLTDISALQSKDIVHDAEIAKINESLVPLWADAEAVSTTPNRIITSAGVVTAAGSDYFVLKKYTVTPSEKYKITGSSAWKNLIYAFFDVNDSLVLKGTESANSGTDTVVTDEFVTAPSGASYVLVAHHTTTLTTSICKYVSAIVPDKSYLRKWVGKKWVCVGDSLTAVNDRTTKHYFDYVAENTGISVVNMGVSGTGYGRRRENNEAFYQRISNCPTDADVVTIFGSFNDIGAGLDIGTVNDTGTTTMAGCINTTIDNLQTVIPDVRLGIVAPTPWDTTQPTSETPAYNYVEMLKAICERRSIPFLDLWRHSNLRPWDDDFLEVAYTKDGGSGTHPDETGHKIIAPHFKVFLESLIM